ncbi:MAG TPA: hypothetical protein VIA09_00280, partial [Nitrososphaeraceae archaeon]
MVLNRFFDLYNRKIFSRFLFLLFCWLILIFTSSLINGNFINKANAQSCTTNLPVSAVTASGND